MSLKALPYKWVLTINSTLAHGSVVQLCSTTNEEDYSDCLNGLVLRHRAHMSAITIPAKESWVLLMDSEGRMERIEVPLYADRH